MSEPVITEPAADLGTRRDDDHRDLTGASRALLADRLDRLQRITRELGAALSVREVTDVVMNILDASVRARSRGLWLHQPGSPVLRLAAEAGMPAQARAQFETIPITSDVPGAVAYRERCTVVSASREEAAARWSGLERTARSTEGFVAIPLLLDDECLGVLGLGYDDDLSPGDSAFLDAVAGQVAQALLRVRLAESERRRRRELEFLADLTDIALAAADLSDLMGRATSAAVPMLGDWCTLHFQPEDGGPMQIAVAHVDPAKVAWARALQERYPYDPDAETGVAAVIRSGKPEVIGEITDALIDDAIQRSTIEPEEARAIVRDLAPTSVVTVPLLTRRRVVGAMQFVNAESGRHYLDADVALAEAVAGRLSDALDRAWLNDQYRDIAITLQRALLPPRLPQVPGVEIAARYWPAGISAVGGDFYDLFQIGSASWAILIGDVCGTGPDAAALTSIARHTVRAAARHGHDHADVMEWLNDAVARSDRDLFCTACFATLTREATGWRLRTTAAGHPLPIHAPQARPATTVGAPGSILGVFDAIQVTTADIMLGSGDVVIFTTDGVTDLPPPHGLAPDQLLVLADDIKGGPSANAIADGIHRSILERVPDPNRQDDIALMVLRVGGD